MKFYIFPKGNKSEKEEIRVLESSETMIITDPLKMDIFHTINMKPTKETVVLGCIEGGKV